MTMITGVNLFSHHLLIATQRIEDTRKIFGRQCPPGAPRPWRASQSSTRGLCFRGQGSTHPDIWSLTAQSVQRRVCNWGVFPDFPVEVAGPVPNEQSGSVTRNQATKAFKVSVPGGRLLVGGGAPCRSSIPRAALSSRQNSAKNVVTAARQIQAQSANRSGTTKR